MIEDWVVGSLPKYEDRRGFLIDLRLGFEKHPVAHSVVTVSKKNVFRGYHFTALRRQSQFVVVLDGRIKQHVLDLRGSVLPQDVKHGATVLSDCCDSFSFLPFGVAHGYEVLSDSCTLLYLLSHPYDPYDEFTINPLDGSLPVKVIDQHTILSDRDKAGLALGEALTKIGGRYEG